MSPRFFEAVEPELSHQDAAVLMKLLANLDGLSHRALGESMGLFDITIQAELTRLEALGVAEQFPGGWRLRARRMDKITPEAEALARWGFSVNEVYRLYSQYPDEAIKEAIRETGRVRPNVPRSYLLATLKRRYPG